MRICAVPGSIIKTIMINSDVNLLFLCFFQLISNLAVKDQKKFSIDCDFIPEVRGRLIKLAFHTANVEEKHNKIKTPFSFLKFSHMETSFCSFFLIIMRVKYLFHGIFSQVYNTKPLKLTTAIIFLQPVFEL